MIETLSQWLEKIILLVLFATFLEMMLPNSSMQRYVKLVMGLMILLAILTPFMQLFKKDFSEEKLALRVMNYNSDSTNSSSLQQIKEHGERLLQQNEQDTKRFVQKQMESLIKAKVEEHFGVLVQSVKISIDRKEMDKEQAYPVISTVQLILDKDTLVSSHGREVKGQNIEIKPIDPVIINVPKQSPDATPAVSTSSNLPEEQRKMLTDVTQFVAETWSIDQARVETKLERKNGEG
ncbi:MAG TPA: stage III sporulation protein AF [Bacillota bacterium]|nr:stage III sporulation protein AF [Bacillota bacterium]